VALSNAPMEIGLTFCLWQSEGTMPDQWNAETYRERARHWRAAADKLPEGRERNVCLTFAESTRTSLS
jgi:hypothetical protein